MKQLTLKEISDQNPDINALHYDSQEIMEILEHEPYVFKKVFDDLEAITAIVAIVGEGEYTHIWASEDTQPWYNTSKYFEVKAPKKILKEVS